MKPREMLKGRYLSQDDLSSFHKEIKKTDKKVVFTAGSWDMIHVGQMRYLTEAKKLGDILVVGVVSNEAIREVKGPNKPILDEWIRAESLAFLKCVDYITILPTPSCKAAIELLKPDIFVSVIEDWASGYKESKEYKAVQDYGGDFKIVDRQSLFISATQIARRVVGAEFAELFKPYIECQAKPIKERYNKK